MSFQAEIGALRELLDFAEREVAPQLKNEGHAEKIALYMAFFWRATTTARAVLLLCEHNFGQQAFMLNRALFESLVDLHWIRCNRQRAEQRFVENARYLQHLKIELSERHAERLGDLGRVSQRLKPGEVRPLERVFRKGSGSWTGLDLPARIASVEASLDDEGDRADLRFFYEVVNRQQNEELHPTSWSLARMLRRVPQRDGTIRLEVRTDPERELVAAALGPTIWIYAAIVAVLVDIFEVPNGERLKDLATRAEAAFRSH